MGYGDIEIKSNSKFLKIESGTPHDIRLMSPSPTVKMVHGFGRDMSVCSGPGCVDCIESDVKQRFSTEVYDHSLKKILTWEFGPAVARQLKLIALSLAEEDRDITEVDLKVDATGSNKEKKYLVTPRMTSKPVPQFES